MRSRLIKAVIIAILIGLLPIRYERVTNYVDDRVIVRLMGSKPNISVELLEMPKADWDWDYSGDFNKYEFYYYDSFLLGISYSYGPEGTTHFRIVFPSCCGDYSAAFWLPSLWFDWGFLESTSVWLKGPHPWPGGYVYDNAWLGWSYSWGEDSHLFGKWVQND